MIARSLTRHGRSTASRVARSAPRLGARPALANISSSSLRALPLGGRVPLDQRPAAAGTRMPSRWASSFMTSYNALVEERGAEVRAWPLSTTCRCLLRSLSPGGK